MNSNKLQEIATFNKLSFKIVLFKLWGYSKAVGSCINLFFALCFCFVLIKIK